jgi:cytoskeletal protein RodZ
MPGLMVHPHAALIAQAQLAARQPMANAAQQQAQRAAAAAAGLEAQRKLAGKKRKVQEKAPTEKVGVLQQNTHGTLPRLALVLRSGRQ